MMRLAIIYLMTAFFLVAPFGTSALAEDDAVKDIFLVTWRGYEEGCEGFESYLKTSGLKYNLIHRDVGQDRSKLPEVIAEIKRLRPDLVVTWGTTVSLGVLGAYDAVDPDQHITDIPAIFMFVANPKRSKLVPNYDSSGRNVTGVRFTLSEAQQLNVAMDSMLFNTMGIVANMDEVNVANSVRAMKKACAKRGVNLIVEEVVAVKDTAEMEKSLKTALSKLKKDGVELVYFPSSSLLNSNITVFTESALALKLPIFSSGLKPVRQGKAAIGVGVSYESTGKRAAVLAEKVLSEGIAPADLTIDEPNDFEIVINMTVVDQLGINVSPEVLSIAEIIRN